MATQEESLIRKPSAFLPVIMSLAGVALVLSFVARYGIVQQADEGTEAHLWQILMVAQMPIIAYFVLRWLPRAPKQGTLVLAVQALAALASFAAVFFLADP